MHKMLNMKPNGCVFASFPLAFGFVLRTAWQRARPVYMPLERTDVSLQAMENAASMRIAVVDDDIVHARFTKDILSAAGHACETFCEASALLLAMQDRTFHLLVFDWNLGNTSGISLLEYVRQRHGLYPPVLFVTGRSSEKDIVAALEAGADDYMTKPLRTRELLARVMALLRRTYRSEVLQVGPYRVSLRDRTVSLRGEIIPLSPREFDLAHFFFRSVGKALPRDMAEQTVWGKVIGSPSRVLDMYVSRLRRKLRLSAGNGLRLVTIHSFGFCLEPCEGLESDSPGTSKVCPEGRTAKDGPPCTAAL